MAITQNSRVRHKRTTAGGTTPTIGPSNDHTDGTWVNEDIYGGEFFIDQEDQIGWYGYDGATTGVNDWFAGDYSVGSITPADEFINTTQVGANIIVDYIGTGNFWAGYELDFIDYNWAQGSGDLIEEIYFPTGSNQVITVLAPVLMQDVVAHKAFYGNFNTMGFTYDGTIGNEVGGATFTLNPALTQDALSNPISGNIIVDCFMFWNPSNDSITFRIGTSGFMPENDTKVRLMVRRRVLFA